MLSGWPNGPTVCLGSMGPCRARCSRVCGRSFDTSEVPVTFITNGVHHLTWVHRELLDLLEAPTGSPSESDGYDWNALAEVDSNTIWALKRRMREDLIAMTRARLAASSANRHVGGLGRQDAQS